MENKPYFCPNCRSNRVKFRQITKYSQSFIKDAINGEIVESGEAVLVAQEEPEIECMVCNVSGNEMRFIKQAEREPRTITQTNPSYV